MNFRLSDDSFEVDIIGKEELNVVARLLGISTTLLWQGITTRTHTVRGQPVKSMSDANLVSMAVRDVEFLSGDYKIRKSFT